MNILPLTILIIFFVFRNSFTLLKGKRNIKQVSSFIYIGRKIIEIVICFLIPGLILLNILEQNIYIPFYWSGVVISVIGLILMISTRLNRNKDWGFMGDRSGDTLFTNGPYRFTRHPYYIGAIFVGIGIYLQLNYILVFLVVPAIFFIKHVISKEEAFLEKEFGQKYMDYRNKVGIFPWFY
jgi:protein-S-isoprenylcysteine O-methyltransferase Ste14